MGNENERKRDPAENRENRMGHQWDEVKTGGDEKTVGLTGDQGLGGGGAGAAGVGSGGAVGGSDAFVSGEDSAAGGGQQAGHGSQGGPAGSNDPAAGSERDPEAKQVLSGRTGPGSFGGLTGSGISAIGANTGQDDLGAAGVGPGGAKSAKPELNYGNDPGSEGSDDDEPEIGPGGQSEIGGASDLGGGETGKGSGSVGSETEDSDDYLERDGNPQAGFAERGRGAPEGTQPGGVEGERERTANRDTDIEGSSTTR